jgi:hypothetical protein
MTITPSSVRTLNAAPMPEMAVTEVGDLPFLHNYLALK